MRNKIVGFIIVGIGFLIGLIVFIFNRALTNIVNASCSHGPSCPMWGTISFHTNVSMGIMIFVLLIGLYLVFFGTEERIVTRIRKVKEQVLGKNISKKHYIKVMESMPEDEKKVLQRIIGSQGSIYQSALIAKDMTKVRVTRILDKLEAKGLIERKRRGMTNMVSLK
jgi:hypothetical protein